MNSSTRASYALFVLAIVGAAVMVARRDRQSPGMRHLERQLMPIAKSQRTGPYRTP